MSPGPRTRASRPGSRAARRSRRSTIRCSPRSSSTARRATRRSRKLQAALDATEIGGLETNLDYLRQLSPPRRARARRDADAHAADFRLPGRHHRGAGARHADHDPGLARPRRLLGGRRAAVGADGSAVVPARQPARRQRRGRCRPRDHALRPDAASSTATPSSASPAPSSPRRSTASPCPTGSRSPSRPGRC